MQTLKFSHFIKFLSHTWTRKCPFSGYKGDNDKLVHKQEPSGSLCMWCFDFFYQLREIKSLYFFVKLIQVMTLVLDDFSMHVSLSHTVYLKWFDRRCDNIQTQSADFRSD